MPRRSIHRVRLVAATPETDAEVAYAVHLDDGAEPHITVDFAEGTAASESKARQAVEPYLDVDEPPRRLLVDTDGNVSVRP